MVNKSNNAVSIKRGIINFLYNYYMTIQSGYIGSSAIIADEPIFPHGQKGIFISGGAAIGKGCTIYQNVTIGSNDNKLSKKYGAPQIGDNVLIGAGATIIGNVKIGDNARISANCAINENIPNNVYVFPGNNVIVRNRDD